MPKKYKIKSSEPIQKVLIKFSTTKIITNLARKYISEFQKELVGNQRESLTLSYIPFLNTYFTPGGLLRPYEYELFISQVIRNPPKFSSEPRFSRRGP
jgi:hypothetical protein